MNLPVTKLFSGGRILLPYLVKMLLIGEHRVNRNWPWSANMLCFLIKVSCMSMQVVH